MLDGDPRLSAVDRARGWAELGELAFLRSRWSRVVDCYARSLGETIDEQPEAIRWMRAWTWNGYAFALLCVGKAEEAFSASERGRAFIPSRHPRDKRLLSETATLHEATALLLLRRFSEAVEILERLEPSLREGLFQREVRGALAFAKAGTICRLDERGVLVAVTSDDPPSGSAP